MIRDATPDDLPLIRDIFARGNDVPYDLARVAEEKCFGAGFAGAPRVRIADEHGVAVTCGDVLRILCVDREHRGRGIGSALLADSNAQTIGAEPGNYFVAGVPDGPMVNWLTKRGYAEKSRTHDVWARHSCLADANEGQTRMSGPPVLAFIEHHFGPIWRFEASRALGIFVIEADNDIAGFAAYEANNRGLGTFGPTGVAPQYRNRGYGRALLHACLAELKRLGYERVIIPWTNAIDFYRKSCNAEVALELVTMIRKP